MPDFRLTREVFRRSLTTCLIASAIALMLTAILFTVTRPSLPPEEELLVYVADARMDTQELDPDVSPLTEAIRESFPQIKRVRFEALPFVSREDIQSALLIDTRMAAGHADVWLCSDAALTELERAEFYIPLDDTAYAADPNIVHTSDGAHIIGIRTRYGYTAVNVSKTDTEAALMFIGLILS